MCIEEKNSPEIAPTSTNYSIHFVSMSIHKRTQHVKTNQFIFNENIISYCFMLIIAFLQNYNISQNKSIPSAPEV